MILLRRSQRLAGICAPLIGLGGIFVAIIINRSWWSITDNAISDLGRVSLPYNWIMNISLIIAALLGIYYATALFEGMNNIGKLGIGIFIMGLAFLGLIGIFPEGTGPHYHVSVGFFVSCSVGMLIAGIGFYIEGDKPFGSFTTLLFIIGWLLAFLAMRRFRGVAIPEFIGIFIIVGWHYMLYVKIQKEKT
ncbi:DUF998 domain-containing protein [Palaeococcus sp. (in: euryarchaeotes)]